MALHPAACGPVLPGIVAHQQQGVDVVPGIFPPVLVEHPGIPGQAHGGKAVVLGDDDITGVHPVHQREVHAVGPFVKNQGFRPGAVKFVGCITKDHAGAPEFRPKPEGNVHHGTAVGINEYFHIIHPGLSIAQESEIANRK